MSESTWTLGRIGRVSYLELLWGFRVPENFIYNLLLPALILISLGLVRPSEEYYAVLVPGLLAIAAAMGSVQGLGATVSYMRFYGTWHTLQASPIPPTLYLVGLFGSRIVRSFITALFLLLVAYVVFNYQVTGNFFLLCCSLLIGTSTFGAMGLFIAFLIRSPQAVQGAITLVMLPMLFVSRAFFSLEAGWLDQLARMLPLTYLVEMVQGSCAQTTNLTQWLTQAAILLVWFAFFSLGTVVLARWRIEEH